MKIRFLPVIICCYVGLACGGEFISQTTQILQDGKAIGKIEVLTPIEIVSKNAAPARIYVKGVVSENYPLQIQKNMKEAEIYAVFDTESEANFKKGKKLEDDYGEIWYEAEGIYEVDSKAVTSDANALYSKAKQVYEETCSACHRLHEPDSFTANQWPANLQGMVEANYVALEENDLNLVTKYLQHNAKKSE
ncbi:MAG: hypothetical protein LUC34_03970 [Campylobacter sp.]|nr:hypothetical protein [Campylobacter sp.]